MLSTKLKNLENFPQKPTSWSSLATVKKGPKGLISGILFSLLLASCALSQKQEVKELSYKPEPVKVEIRPGRVRFFSFYLPEKMEIEGLYCKDKKIDFYRHQDTAEVYLAESYFSDLSGYECEIRYQDNGSSKNITIANVEVKDYPYKEEFLKVDKRRVFLSKEDLKRVKAEREILNKVFSNTFAKPLFRSPFKAPLNSKITSVYGNRRVFNNKKKSQHLGTDFRARVGVPITPANRGKVVFTGNLFYAGNMVIIDHGIGVFTSYGHLSQINVSTGDIVDTHTVVGLSGKTGRVSGPHLHWGARVQGFSVNGFSLVEESNKGRIITSKNGN